MTRLLIIFHLFCCVNLFAVTRVVVTNNSNFEVKVGQTKHLGGMKRSEQWAQLASSIGPGKKVSILSFNRASGVKKGKFFYFQTALSLPQFPEVKIILSQSLYGTSIHSQMWSSMGLLVNGKKLDSCDSDWKKDRYKYICNYITQDSYQRVHELNITVNALETLGSDNIEISLHAPIPTINAQEKNKLNVLAMNTFMRPASIFSNGQWKRAKILPFLISNYDVLVLSEVFDDSIRLFMKMYLRKFYPYYSKVVGHDKIISQDGGVIIFSKWPILDKKRKINHRVYKKNCNGSDCWSDKGVVHVAINKKGMIYHIFGTHMQANKGKENALVRQKQFGIISRFIKDLNIPKSQPVIISGDLNVDMWSGPLEYQNMLRTLQAFHPPLKSSSFSYDPNTNNLAKIQGQNKSELLDYILTEKEHLMPHYSFNEVVPLKAYHAWEKEKKDLSDHYPIYGFLSY